MNAVRRRDLVSYLRQESNGFFTKDWGFLELGTATDAISPGSGNDGREGQLVAKTTARTTMVTSGLIPAEEDCQKRSRDVVKYFFTQFLFGHGLSLRIER